MKRCWMTEVIFHSTAGGQHRKHLSLKTTMNIAEFIITPFAVREDWDGFLPVHL